MASASCWRGGVGCTRSSEAGSCRGGNLAQLGSEVLGAYDVPIEFDVAGGKGTIRVGDAAMAQMHPYTDAQGRPTKLMDTVFSTIPGSRTPVLS